jgi:hypothetical protein
MSLLTIIQRCADLLGLERPPSVIGSADQQVRQLYALALEEAEELHSRYAWQALTREQTFTSTAATAQTDAFPADFSRFLNSTFFDRTTRRPVLGPITPQLWQGIQANPQLNRVFLAFRERNGQFLVTPTPTGTDTIAYEYITSKWARNAALTTNYTEWQDDTDTSYLSESLIRLGIRWRFKKSKGLPYGEDFDTYQAQCDQFRAQDGGSATISLTGREYQLGYLPNIPEGNWNQ